jgi:uncharacterized protein
MTSQLFWTLILVQIGMGAFDTLVHHELTERLAWRPSQGRELALHGARNLLYAVLFVVLGWLHVHGILALLVIGILAVEVVITLMDFVEEDRSRKLQASERINHTLLALNYGAILTLLVPVLLNWARQPTALGPAYYGYWSLFAGFSAFAVALFGLRDLAASIRARSLVLKPAGALVMALSSHHRILVTGATGFVGRRLVEGLTAEGHSVIVLTRSPGKALCLHPPYELVTDLDQISPDAQIDAIVNLAGEPISDRLWTQSRRRLLVQSRVKMTSQVVKLIARLDKKPSVLVNASAIGWYGLQDDVELNEESASTSSFSHDLCAAWEAEAGRAAQHGVRVALLRIGLVMGVDGGLLSRLLTPFELGVGGPIGSGKQWMSWIERDDLVRLIAHVIATPQLDGPINATAPTPVRNAEFSKALAGALHRPALLRVPALPLRLLAADFARELLLGGQRVVPQKAVKNGFAFHYSTLNSALQIIVGGVSRKRRANREEVAHRLSLN